MMYVTQDCDEFNRDVNAKVDEMIDNRKSRGEKIPNINYALKVKTEKLRISIYSLSFSWFYFVCFRVGTCQYLENYIFGLD